MEGLFFDIGLVIIASSLVGVLGFYLKQPLILAYIIAGFLIGPIGLGLVHDVHIIESLSSFGIMLMLFLVGLEMNPVRLKELGRVAIVAGLGQMLFTGLFGYFMVRFFGFSPQSIIYVTVALTLSSTVIALKIINDKGDMNAQYAQLAIGILLVQDIVAIFELFVLSGFEAGSFAFDVNGFLLTFLKGGAVAVLAVVLAKKLLGRLYNFIADSHELLILFSLAWAFLIALVSEYVGFSVEIGAFIAGLSIASFPYTYEITAKAKVLRDFFITLFFVALGAGLSFAGVSGFIVPIIVLSLFVLIGNPMIVMLIMGLYGYDKRTSFFVGLTIANISEFSLMIVAMGLTLGHVDSSIVGFVTLVSIITMTLSSYMLTFNNQLYNALKKYLSIFEFHKKTRLSSKTVKLNKHIILLGAGRMGQQILSQIRQFKESYLVVDHDNTVIKKLIDDNVTCIFGDMEDEDLMQELDFEDAEIVISTLPQLEDNLYLLRHMSKLPKDKRPFVIVTADSGRAGLELFNSGADYIILKPYLGAEHIHQINKELYELEEEGGQDVAAFEGSTKDIAYRSDHEYARVLHNLNKLRLGEIKRLLKNKDILLTKKEGTTG